mmetsp:Transcript_971/g.2521  ORF Transcript_971/g.2521 Transcript_971/m.2521 type:complete len:239 (-) Transcript_971:8-724(-)
MNGGFVPRLERVPLLLHLGGEGLQLRREVPRHVLLDHLFLWHQVRLQHGKVDADLARRGERHVYLIVELLDGLHSALRQVRRLGHLARHVELLVLEVGDQVGDRVVVALLHIGDLVLVRRAHRVVLPRRLVAVVVAATPAPRRDRRRRDAVAILVGRVAPPGLLRAAGVGVLRLSIVVVCRPSAARRAGGHLLLEGALELVRALHGHRGVHRRGVRRTRAEGRRRKLCVGQVRSAPAA